MADERDLELRITADGTAAKAELGETAAAEREIGVAAEEAGAIAEAAIDRHAALLSELTSANNAAANAVREMAVAGETGGKAYTVSVLAARDAVARLEIAVAAVRAQGGPVSPAMIAELGVFDTAVAAATAGLEKHAAASKGLAIEASVARGSVGGLSQALKAIGGVAGEAGLAFLVAEAVLRLIPIFMKSVEDAGTGLGNMYSKLTLGVDETTKKEAQLNNELAKQDQHSKAAADATDLHARTLFALSQGVIAATENTVLLNAQTLAHEAALRGQVQATGDLAKAIKDLGIVQTASLEDFAAKQRLFIYLYQAHLSEGEAAADHFAKANKKFMQELVDEAGLAGERLRPEFQKIVDKLHVTTKEYEEQTKAIDQHKAKIAELEASLKKHAQTLADHAKEIEKHRITQETSADAEYQAVRKGLDAQLVALEKSRRDGLVTEEKYRDDYARIQNDQVEARRSWERQVDEINRVAAEKLGEQQKKFNDDTANTIKKKEEETLAYTKLDLERERVHLADIARRHAQDTGLDQNLKKLSEVTERLTRVRDLQAEIAKDAPAQWNSVYEAIDSALGKLGQFATGLRELTPEEAAGPGIPVG